jgi:DnaK suppressor protein
MKKRNVSKKTIRTNDAPTADTKAAASRNQRLRELLHQKRREVVQSIETQLGRQLSEDVQQQLDAALDVGDQSQADLTKDMDLTFLERQNETRKDIEAALGRIEEGTYGLCESCGDEIPEKRLTAMPFARFCITCQERHETLQRIEREEDRFK